MEDNSWSLERVPCIYHTLRFQKDLHEIRLLIDWGSEVNIMTPAYGAKLDFEIQKTDIKAQKTDVSNLDTFEMILANFQGKNKLSRTRFF